MSYYTSISLYIESATDLEDKVVKYNAIISALEDAALKGAEMQDIEEYWLDDGQTKIKNVYRNPNDIFKAILSYERLRQICLNKLNGRGMRLIDFDSNSNCKGI